ncbi:MAG: AraC family transcriptional regulator, partial [Candidatus Cloacimonadota bacterium]|nr:AraC family transcriptional regulator [Candidatus Cloacimonadota bacterium]
IFERLLDKKSDFTSDINNTKQGKFEQAQKFINRNYNKNINLDDVAKEIFLSTKYISRKLKEKTGKGFMELKKELRIKMAKRLLRETNLTVSQIAYKVGYQNPESFMKLFKRVVGMVSSSYRTWPEDIKK